MKKRGEVWWINFDPALGQEIKKQRPAIIVSNDISNTFLNRYQLVPLSSQIQKLYPSETIIKIGGKPCKAMADQLTTVSIQRFTRKIGEVKEDELKAVETIFRMQLGL